MPRNWLSTRNPNGENGENGESSEVRGIFDAAHADERHRSQNYGTTSLRGRSQAILGNVYHTYHHYHGSIETRQRANESQSTSDHVNSSLEVSNIINGISLDSISDYDPEWALWLRRADRLPDTCQWIFRSREYRDWQSSRGSPTLFCVGPVGCGKSMTASAVVDALTPDNTISDSLVISYFVDTSQNQTPAARDVIRALIKQIVVFAQKNNLRLSNTLLDRLRILLSRTTNHFALDAFAQTFRDLVTHCVQCTVIIDGLDLLKEDEIIQCLHFFRSINSNPISSPTTLKTIIFCRETLGRGIRVENHADSAVLQISLKHIERDIHCYIDHAVSNKHQERTITNDTDLITEVLEVLKKNSARMFLWAKLQVESLWNPNLITTDSSIRAQLKSLPENLDETYLVCLKRIQETNLASSQDIAPIVFRWIASAGRPLYAAEARELVSMDYINEPITTNSQLLSCPVTDYCANLVVYNHFSGRVEFAHPTVKSFLSERSKIPPEFKHFCILNMDDTRCGHLSLIYLSQYRNQNQLVLSRKLQVSPKVASPVLKVVSESWPALRWASAKTERRRKVSNEHQLQIAMPTISKPDLSEANNAAHGYICHNWLWHTSHIAQTHEDFENFNELCLCHNADFQPWSEPQRKESDHYARLVAHAVMANHPPLLQIAMDELIAHHDTRQVFHQPCIGSDSGLLHVAAALGHTTIAKMLLPHTFDYADSQGKSAAAIAAECRQDRVLAAIMAANSKVYSFGSPVRQLRTFSPGPPVYENLLNVCATAGNLEATKIVLSTFEAPNSVMRGKYLSAALISAGYKGHIGIAKYLMDHGALPEVVETAFLNFPSLSLSFGGSIESLWLALEAKNLQLFDTLLALGTVGSNYIPQINFHDFFIYLDISGPELELFMTSIALRQGFRFLPYDTDRLSLLEDLITLTSCDDVKASISYTRILRILLTNLKAEDIAISVCVATRNIPLENLTLESGINTAPSSRIGISRNEIESWLSITPDDVLIFVLRQSWIAEEYLISPSCLETLANRPTSRALEALLEHAARAYWQGPELSLLRRLGFPHTFYVEGARYFGPSLSDKVAEPDLQQLLDFDANYDSQLTSTDPYLFAKYIIVTTAARCSSRQILEFFACTICPNFTDAMISKIRCDEDYNSILHAALHTARWRTYGTETLRWVRCIIFNKGDTVAAAKLCTEMAAQGSDVNFALNWPAGYCTMKNDDGAEILCFNRAILLGVYGWNFRLRRSQKKPFSPADIWYVAIKLTYALHERIRPNYWEG